MTAQSTAPLNVPFSGNDVGVETARSTSAMDTMFAPVLWVISARSV